MKSNAWLTLLMAMLFLNAAGTALLAFQYVRTMKNLPRLQVQRAWISREMGLFQALVNDSLEYSKRNPALEPVLQSIGLKTKPGVSTNRLSIPPK